MRWGSGVAWSPGRVPFSGARNRRRARCRKQPLTGVPDKNNTTARSAVQPCTERGASGRSHAATLSGVAAVSQLW